MMPVSTRAKVAGVRARKVASDRWADIFGIEGASPLWSHNKQEEMRQVTLRKVCMLLLIN